MSPLLTLVLTLLPAAHAGMVGAIAPGTPVAGLLLCTEGSACIEEARWLAEHSTESVSLPVMFFNEALSDPGDSHAAALGHRRAFDDALVVALAAWAAGDLDRAAAQLDVADRELAALILPVPQQSLFDLYFIRGGVASSRQEKAASLHFARAAAVAWNRTVTLPTPDGSVAKAYQEAQHRIMHASPGTLVLAAPPEGGVWNVDGVEIGAQAASLTVLPGAHRVIASIAGRARYWAATLSVDPGKSLSVAAAFPPELPIESLADRLREQIAGAPADPLATEVLQAWASQRRVGELRVFYVAGAPFSVTTLTVAGSAAR